MWWKLSLLAVVTVALVIAVQPIRTHAVKMDITLDGSGGPPPQSSWRLMDMLSNMYVTPSSLLIVAAIVAVATYFALRIIRG
jgi:hypothetical protein